ncbi:MAG: hypothetical protein V8Q84_06785 [Bilophila sp.]
MKRFIVQVPYTDTALIEVDADSPEEAIAMAKAEEYVSSDVIADSATLFWDVAIAEEDIGHEHNPHA